MYVATDSVRVKLLNTFNSVTQSGFAEKNILGPVR